MTKFAHEKPASGDSIVCASEGADSLDEKRTPVSVVTVCALFGSVAAAVDENNPAKEADKNEASEQSVSPPHVSNTANNRCSGDDEDYDGSTCSTSGDQAFNG